ncbi:MAG: iron-sulfur cluster assembly scaffold protein [Sphingomonadales bacterium]|nr:iron-sulfur cluster assembly scaffold protein [Sphingomonadales bacterium]NCQ20936.1 iron-sulfur cluster assembly scaffold protein [Sphingomonadales bacterium]NCT02694.1 iron-sulfur cluster assembly scaffold protein [Sphingomonadales bacterium]
MTNRPAVKLYSPALLGLATELSHFPLTQTLELRAEARSRSCGSVITIGLTLGADDTVSQIGMQVSACAIGQASAALMARSAVGAAPSAITMTTAAISRWLAGEGDLPDWPALELVAPALAHPGRHGALLLPWKAACEALSHTSGSR